MSGNGNGNGNGLSVKVGAGNEVAREEFGARQVSRSGETASTALATQARAAVEARFVMAMQRPRSMDTVRVKILEACKRPFFAEDALYSKPVGKAKNDETGKWEEKFVEGLSIRFAEEAVRLLGNAMTETVTIYDDPQKRMVRLSATDLETNVVHYKDITVEKTVERRVLKKGQQALGQRVNSYGDVVYLVEATEDDLAKKEGALGAKAIRDKMLMLIPADIKEEARALVKETQNAKDAADPDAAKRKIIDSFAAVGIMPDKIVEYLGHDLGAVQPAELQELRKIYSAIKDGEATWASFVEQKSDAKGDDKPAAPAATPTQGVRVSLRGAGAAAPAQAPGAPTTVSGPAAAPAQETPAPETKAPILVKDAASAVAATKKLEQEQAVEQEDKGDDPLRDTRSRGSAPADDNEMPTWAGGPQRGGRK